MRPLCTKNQKENLVSYIQLLLMSNDRLSMDEMNRYMMNVVSNTYFEDMFMIDLVCL